MVAGCESIDVMLERKNIPELNRNFWDRNDVGRVRKRRKDYALTANATRRSVADGWIEPAPSHA
jgi:hypothetical protein